VAINGNKQWPNNVIPYDMSEITNVNDQQTILNSMQTLMYAVGTPIPDSLDRQVYV